MCEKYLCKTCGQPLPPKQREGVWLSAKKAQIFDFIDKHPGITAEGILAQCFTNGTKVNLVRQHVYQINSLLAGTSIRISGRERGVKNFNAGVKGFYRVIRPRPR